MSERCAGEKFCARTACGAATASNAAQAAAIIAQARCHRFCPCCGHLIGAAGGLDADDIVGAHPGGRADGQAGLGARRKLPRGPDVAAREGGLRGGEIGLGEVALAAIGHGELSIGVGRFRFAAERGAQKRDGLFGVLGVVGGDQRLAEHDVDQRRAVRERHRVAQRRDRLGRVAAFQQRLALELIEIRIVRLRLDQAVDLRDGVAPVAVAIGRDGAGIARRQAVIARADSGDRRCRADPGSRTISRASCRGAAAVRASL